MTDTIRPGDPADKAADAKADGAFQGSHRAGYGEMLARVEAWLRAHPSATLASGEGAALLEEIDRLRQQLYLANESAASSSAHAATLRAAIERVRALHRPTLEGAHCVVCHSSDSSDWDFYPCPTLRALDEEDA